jgi:hypothetical protein
MMNVSKAEMLPIPVRILPSISSNRMAFRTNPVPLPKFKDLPQPFFCQRNSDEFGAAALVPNYPRICFMKIQETRT